MDKKYLLISIKPEYAAKIKAGEKTIELRKIAPKVKSGDVLVIYESTPVKRITAYCDIKEIIKEHPSVIWDRMKKSLGISKERFDDYYRNRDFACGIVLAPPTILKKEKALKELSPTLTAPQSYRYITASEFETLQL